MTKIKTLTLTPKEARDLTRLGFQVKFVEVVSFDKDLYTVCVIGG